MSPFAGSYPAPSGLHPGEMVVESVSLDGSITETVPSPSCGTYSSCVAGASAAAAGSLTTMIQPVMTLVEASTTVTFERVETYISTLVASYVAEYGVAPTSSVETTDADEPPVMIVTVVLHGQPRAW